MTAISILVVDDEQIIGTMFKRELESKGYNVDVALNGMEAMKLVGKNHYDLVFLDMMMPEMNGIETCREIKKIKPDQIMALMTGKIDKNTLKKEVDFVEAGGKVFFLYKPFSEDEITDVIKKALGEKGRSS